MISKRRLVHDENHEGYHGHYHRDSGNLVSSEELDSLSRPEGCMKFISRNSAAFRRTEAVVVSDRDFVSTDTEEVFEQRTGVVEDVFRKVQNHGDDFRRGDFMFTPVVKSVMKSVAAEAKQRGVRINTGTSDPPRQSSVPEGDIKQRLDALRRKRNAVNFADKKEGRTVGRAVSRRKMELKREMESLVELNKKLQREGSENAQGPDSPGFKAPTAPSTVPSAAVASTSAPTHPTSNKPSFVTASVTGRPKTNHRVLLVPASGHPSIRNVISSESPRDETDSPSATLAPADRINLKPDVAVDLSRRFNPTTTQLINSAHRHMPNTKNQKPFYKQDILLRRKKKTALVNQALLLRDRPDSGIKKGLCSSSSEEDDDDNGKDDVEYNTFKSKGYTRRKRAGLMVSANPELLRAKSQGDDVETSPTRLKPTDGDIANFMRQASSGGTSDDNQGDANNNHSVKMAGLFIMTMFAGRKSKPVAMDSVLEGANDTAVHAGAAPSTPSAASLMKSNTTKVGSTTPFQSSDKDNTISSSTPAALSRSFGHERSRTHTAPASSPVTKSPRRFRGVAPPPRERTEREKLDEWLAKRMTTLLDDYMKGDVTAESELSEEDKIKQIYDERTISTEISLLYRGFQTVDKNKDGFLQSEDLFELCRDTHVKLSKHEIDNAMWLMDDTLRGYLTFDEVMNFYLRKRREFLASGKDYKVRGVVEAEELAKLKIHQQQYVLTECDMHSQPLLLFRMLFFIAMQDSKGEIHLLTAFQNLSQLFGRVAEEQFNCIFLKNFANVTDDDRYTLAEFVDYIKKFRVKVKHTKIVVKEHYNRKAALIRLKAKGADSVAADRRNAIASEGPGGNSLLFSLACSSSPGAGANPSPRGEGAVTGDSGNSAPYSPRAGCGRLSRAHSR